MVDKVVYQLPSEGDFSVVELDDGRRYRKQLVKFGNWVNPSDPRKKMVLDKSWAAQVVQNFKDKVLNRVPVVEGHPKTSGELLAATRCWLAGLSVEDDGIYGELDITASDTTTKIDNGLFDDVSISFDPDYLDKLKGDNVGPALLHVGIVKMVGCFRNSPRKWLSLSHSICSSRNSSSTATVGGGSGQDPTPDTGSGTIMVFED